MNNEQKFWIIQWAITGIIVLGVTGIGVSYWKDHNTKIVSLIEKGVPPVEVMCAMQGDHNDGPLCILVAAKK